MYSYLNSPHGICKTAHVCSQYVPVDTIICFRASMPLIIALIEWTYLDRELPSARSWASMLSARTSLLGFLELHGR